MTDGSSPGGWLVSQLLNDAAKVTNTHLRAGAKWDYEAQGKKMAEEVIEVVKAVYTEPKAKVAEEICDVIFSALTMAHLYNLSATELEIALEKKLSIIQERATQRAGLMPKEESR